LLPNVKSTTVPCLNWQWHTSNDCILQHSMVLAHDGQPESEDLDMRHL